MSPYSAWPFLSDPGQPFLSAVWAVAIHGLLALVAIAPIVWRSDHRLRYAVLTFVGGSALDLDHFIAAGSLDLHTIETMAGRPDTHSLLFVLVLGLATLLVTRRRIAAWAVVAVNLSHLLFDAAGGGVHILYPSTRPDALPWLACPLGTLVLLGCSTVFAGGVTRPAGPRRRDRTGALPVA